MSLPQRKQIRLKNYDYSSNGACHIIICTHRKQKLFWKSCRVNPTIPRLVGAYKSIVSNTYLKICKERNVEMGRIWQVSYFDHVIRGPQDYEETWRYIDENPLKYILKKGDMKNAENS